MEDHNLKLKRDSMIAKGDGEKLKHGKDEVIKQLLNFRLSPFMIINVKYDFDPEDGASMYL